MLGGEVTVPTVTGHVSLKVPPGTQNGKRFRISGKGMPKLGTPSVFGDLYVTVKAVLPEGLTEDERRLFERLRDIEGAKKRGAFV
jgi:DnaJ-class molecular chaperone